MRWIKNRRDAAGAWLGPVWSGFLQGSGLAVLLGANCAGLAVYLPVPEPPATVFHDLLQVGIGLLVAFSVATAAAGIAEGESIEDHLAWLSACAGIGAAGLGAISLCVALAAFLESGHSGALAQVGLGFVVAALFLLGLVVALLPWLSFHWHRDPGGPASQGRDRPLDGNRLK